MLTNSLRWATSSALEMQEAVIKAVSDFSRGDLYDDVTVLVMTVSLLFCAAASCFDPRLV
jgi:hypothetical protein